MNDYDGKVGEGKDDENGTLEESKGAGPPPRSEPRRPRRVERKDEKGEDELQDLQQAPAVEPSKGRRRRGQVDDNGGWMSMDSPAKPKLSTDRADEADAAIILNKNKHNDDD